MGEDALSGVHSQLELVFVVYEVLVIHVSAYCNRVGGVKGAESCTWLAYEVVHYLSILKIAHAALLMTGEKAIHGHDNW